MGARQDFFTVKNLTIGIVSLVLIIIVGQAIGLENTPGPPSGTQVPPSGGWTVSGIIILFGICGLVGSVLYLVAKKKDPAYDWVPAADRAMFQQLIEANNKYGIEMFLEFISLYGLTGYIKRLGLSGLPLLTVLLTLIFSILAELTWLVGLYFPNATEHDISTAAMDLAKLTLGAFIGSFVQRNVPVGEKPSHVDHPAPPVPAPVPTPPDPAVVPTPPDPAVVRK